MSDTFYAGECRICTIAVEVTEGELWVQYHNPDGGIVKCANC